MSVVKVAAFPLETAYGSTRCGSEGSGAGTPLQWELVDDDDFGVVQDDAQDVSDVTDEALQASLVGPARSALLQANEACT